MVLELKKVETSAEKKAFIKLPWKIYRNNPCNVLSLFLERKKFLNPEVNPFFTCAEVDYYLVLAKNGERLGRIAFILNHTHNEFHSEKTGFFGLFESVDDQRVADLLLNAVYERCRARKLEKLLGPVNLSTNHECGLLVENFDDPPLFGTPYNLPYYSNLLTQWGLAKAKDLISFKIEPFVKVPEYLERAMVRIRKRNRFSVRCLRMEQFEKEIEIFWGVYNSAWSRNWGFVPMTREEFIFSANEMKHIVDPDFCFIAEIDGEPAGFSLTLPDINQVLKTMNGRLFPFGWLKFLMNRKKINSYRVLTLGVKKKFQRLGIDAYFYYETYKRFVEKKVAMSEMSWVLEDNQAMLTSLHRMGAVIYRRHRIYERTCEN